MDVINELSRRLSPLSQFADQAGGLFGGLRIPGLPSRVAVHRRRRRAPAPPPAPAPAAKKAPAKKRAAKKAPAEAQGRRHEEEGRRQLAADASAADERGRHDGAGQVGAADVDDHRGALGDVRRHEGEGDAVTEHRREVAARDDADLRRRRRARRSPARGGRRPSVAMPTSVRATPASRSAIARLAAAELRLVPRHDPAEPGLQRRDARPELVAVQRQAGLQAQRVAGAEPGRADAGGDDRLPQVAPPRRPARRSRRRARPCSRCRPRRTACRPTSAAATRKRPTAAASGKTVAEPFERPRPLHGEHGTVVGRLVAADRRRAPGRCSTRWASRRTRRRRRCHHTMMSSSTEPSASSRRWVYWARPGAILPRSLVSARCSALERIVARDADGAEVGHVEHDGVGAAGQVLVDRAVRVLERHLPAAERHHPGAERAMDVVERRVLERHIARRGAASCGRPRAPSGEQLGVDVVLDAGRAAAR